jgi:hypothetical protein
VQAWRKDRQERDKAHKRKTDSDAAMIAALEKDLEMAKQKLHGSTQGASAVLSLCRTAGVVTAFAGVGFARSLSQIT